MRAKERFGHGPRWALAVQHLDVGCCLWATDDQPLPCTAPPRPRLREATAAVGGRSDPAAERERKELGVGLVARVATSEHIHLLASAGAPAVENDFTVLPLLEIGALLPFEPLER